VHNLEAAWETIINKAGCPVVVTDARAKDNPIVFVNSRFEELSGYRKEEVVGHNPRLLHGLERNQPGLAELRQAINERRPCRVAIRDYRKDGKPYWVEASVSPIFDKQGDLTHFIGIQQDITQLIEESGQKEEFIQELAREVAQHETRSRMIIERSLDAFVSMDENGKINDWNDRAELLFGLDRQHALGEDFATLFLPESERRQFKKRFLENQPALAGERSELTLVNNYGRQVPVEMSIFVIEFRREKNYCAFFQDISLRKDAEQKIRDFYALLSHELRSPLASIRGSLGLIEGGLVGTIPPEAAEMIRLARESSERLAELLNDILDLKKIEAGKFELHFELIDLALIIKEAVQGLVGMAKQSTVSLATVFEKSGAIVSADHLRLLQILTNLISNGIKFSPEGTTLTVRLLKVPGYWRSEVIDHGPGIASEDLSRLFDKFKQLHTSDSKRGGGTGLGLAISKALVEQHQGRIGVISKLQEGSTFWFDLPEATESTATN
jgi:PAS domain S-box-containing protein